MAGGPETKRIFFRDTWVKRGDGTSRNTYVLYPALLGILIAIGGALTFLAVRGHIIDSLRDELVTIQDSQEAAVRRYLRGRPARMHDG